MTRDGLPRRQGLLADAVTQPRIRRARLFVLFLSCLQSPRELARPTQTRRRLIATLFGRASNVLMVALAALICGTAACLRTGGWTAPAITSVEVILLLARCAVIVAFQKQDKDGELVDADIWLVCFGGLAVGSSIAWGALCFLSLATFHDPLLYVLPVLSTVGTAGAVAARNSGVPRLAKIQLACSLSPILAGCMLTEDHGYRLLLLLVPAMAVGLAILIAERNAQLVALIETQGELARLSHTDALTQVPNRRYLDARLRDAADPAQPDRPFALLMIDVDNFKRFNDRHGHLAGDALLLRIAVILKGCLRRDSDVIARYGGEEFAILLADVGAAAAEAFAERVRMAVEAMSLATGGGSAATISIGVAVGVGDPQVLIRAADEALYRAKRQGRNRVEAAAPLPGVPPDPSNGVSAAA